MVRTVELHDKPLNGHSKPSTLVSDAHRQAGQVTRSSIRKTLHQSLKLKDLAFDLACRLDGMFSDAESAELARAQAQALTALTKSWAESVGVSRVERGIPGPGTLRPESKPRKPAKSKPQQTLLDQDQPACGPSHTAAPSSPPPEPEQKQV